MIKTEKEKMKNKVRNYIREQQMLRSGERVIVALSGGADSVCLLLVLWELRQELGIEIKAVHVHHGIRGKEADRDAAFSEEVCSSRGIPVEIVKRDVPRYAIEHNMTLEEAGRVIRYQIFKEEAEVFKAAAIAVAHHQDDQAETILHHLFRGSGLRGLSGIRPIREMQDSNKEILNSKQVIRPLLTCSRQEIIAYLEKKGQTWCQDSTNNENKYTRNKLRHQIIPMLVSEVNPKAVENIIHAGELMALADEYMEQAAEDFLKKYGNFEAEENYMELDLKEFSEQKKIIRSYVIHQSISRLCKSRKDITSRHIEEVCALPEKKVGSRCHLPYGLIAERNYDKLWIGNNTMWKTIQESGTDVEKICDFHVFSYCREEEIPQKQYTKWFDYDKIKDTLLIRTRETGDYITLPGGGKKTVKSYMIDQKIPRQERDKIPLLADGKHIVWIIGYRISESYKITSETEHVLQVQYNGGNKYGR